MNELEVVV